MLLFRDFDAFEEELTAEVECGEVRPEDITEVTQLL